MIYQLNKQMGEWLVEHVESDETFFRPHLYFPPFNPSPLRPFHRFRVLRFRSLEPSYPVGYIGSLYLLDEADGRCPPPFFRLACCSLHRCYRIVTDVGLSICFDTTRCSFCFSRPPPL